MAAPADLDAVIAKYATRGFTDSTALLDAGIQSLSLLRLVVDVLPDDDAEIDVTSTADLRTIGELKAWLVSLTGDRA